MGDPDRDANSHQPQGPNQNELKKKVNMVRMRTWRSICKHPGYTCSEYSRVLREQYAMGRILDPADQHDYFVDIRSRQIYHYFRRYKRWGYYQGNWYAVPYPPVPIPTLVSGAETSAVVNASGSSTSIDALNAPESASIEAPKTSANPEEGHDVTAPPQRQ